MRRSSISIIFALPFLSLVTACGSAGSGTARCNEAPSRATTGGTEAAPAEDTATSTAATDDEAAPPAEVRALADAPRRTAPNDQAWITFLSRGRNAFLGRLEMAPGAAVPEHQDPTEEYVHVLEGTGTMVIDGEEHAVGPGSTIFMPADVTVSYQNGPARMVAIQVFAGPEPAAKYDRWTPTAAAP
jgi:quercetin dioxygenase-like cupin family protein